MAERMTTPERLLRELEQAKSHRQTMDEHLQEIADLVITKRAAFTTTPTVGGKRTRKQYDATAPWSNEQLANGLHSIMTSLANRWFYLRMATAPDRASYAELLWLESVVDIMFEEVFNAPSSGFHSNAHEVYLDSGALGTGILYSEEVVTGGVSFRARFLGECYMLENEAGLVNQMFREFMMPVHQFVERFGVDALPDEKKKKYQEGAVVEDIEVIHAVKPNSMFNMQRIRVKTNMPIASVYLMREGDPATKKATIVSESGYNEFPFHVFRFSKRTGEVWGEGPGMRALPDIKMINEMKKTVLKAAQKIVDPPLQLPDDGFLGPVITRPGGLNYYRAGSPDRIEPLETRSRPDIGLDLINSVQQDIMQAFFVDAFNTPDENEGVNVKAAFVYQRREEKFRQLASMTARAENEFIGPLINRVFNVLFRQGKFPEMPSSMQNRPLTIEYISPISRAQRATQGEDVLRLMELIAPLADLDPGVWDNFDADNLARIGAERLYNVPVGTLRSPDEVAERRAQREEQDAQANELGNIQAGAAAAKDLSSAISNGQA